MRPAQNICAPQDAPENTKDNMGTRHLTIVKADGRYTVAQYGQWDGYPERQGQTVIDFLLKYKDYLAAAEEKFAALRFYTDEEYELDVLEKYWEKSPYGGYTMSYGSPEKELWDTKFKHLSRDTGADILDLVMESKIPLKLRDSLSFVGDSLLCEWAYVIDFDTGTFEVYKGGNKTPIVDGRFTTAEFGIDNGGVIEYHPVRLIFSKPLQDIDGMEVLEIYEAMRN